MRQFFFDEADINGVIEEKLPHHRQVERESRP
jgi:hypothetical protein